jgi:hypothetical protein
MSKKKLYPSFEDYQQSRMQEICDEANDETEQIIPQEFEAVVG